MMPRQLEAGLLRRRYSRKRSPRPIVEQLQRIDVADLCRYQVFPDNHYETWLLELPFKYPFVEKLLISRQTIEAKHYSGYNQITPLRWVRTGFGGHRSHLICQYCRPVTKLYFNYGNCIAADASAQSMPAKSAAVAPHAHTSKHSAYTISSKPCHSESGTAQEPSSKLATKPWLSHKLRRITDKARQIQSNYRIAAAAYWR
jgi:hypothetical protein